MSEGVSYQWTIDSDLKGVDAGVKTLRDAEKGLTDLWAKTIDSEKALEELKNPIDKLKGADLGHISKGLAPIKGHADHAAEGFKGVGHSIKEASGHFKEFLEFTGAMLAVEAIEKITEKVIELGKEILHAAGGAERMDLSLKLTVGADGAKNVLEWVDAIASRTRFTDDQLKGWVNQLLRAGVAMKDVRSFIEAGLDLNAMGGDMGTAMEALTRAQITGKIGARQLVGLGIGVNQLKELPEYQGLSEKALYKKVEEGSLTKEQLFSLIAGKDNTLGDLGLKGGQDFEAKLKNLKSLPEQYFQKMAESPSFEHLKEVMGDIFTKLDPNSERGAAIFKSLERSFTKLVDEIAKIDFEQFAVTLETRIVPAIEQMMKLLSPLLSTAAPPVIKAMEVATSLIPGTEANKALKSVQDPWSAGIAGMLGKQKGADTVDGFAAGIKDSTPKAADATSDVGQKSIDAMSAKLDSHSPSRVFERLGQNVGDGFIIGVEGSTGGVDDVMQGAFAIPAPQGGRAVPAGAGDVYLTVEVNVDGHHGDATSARELGQAVGESVRAILPSALADALEQLNASGGNS